METNKQIEWGGDKDEIIRTAKEGQGGKDYLSKGIWRHGVNMMMKV